MVHTMFHPYGISGNIEDDLTLSQCYVLAKAIQLELSGTTAVIGYDDRKYSYEAFKVMKLALESSGVEVTELGVVTTEMVNYFSNKLNTNIGIMLAIEPESNYQLSIKLTNQGGKVLLPSQIDGIKTAFNIHPLTVVNGHYFSEVLDYNPKIKYEYYEQYYDHLCSITTKHREKTLKVVIDANCGVAGLFFDYLVENQRPNIELITINNSLFKNFEGRNPSDQQNKEELIYHIEMHDADLGISFSMDGSQVFFFNKNGMIKTQIVTAMLMNHLINNPPKQPLSVQNYKRFVIDNRSLMLAHAVSRFSGSSIYPSKVGEYNIIDKMVSTDSYFGSELGGFYYYKSLNNSRSGLLTALLMIGIYTNEESIDFISDEYQCTEEMSYHVPTQYHPTAMYDSIYWNMMKSFNNPDRYHLDILDGLVIESTEAGLCENDFRISIRKSNSTGLMKMNIESTTMDNEEFKSFTHHIDLIMKGIINELSS